MNQHPQRQTGLVGDRAEMNRWRGRTSVGIARWRVALVATISLFPAMGAVPLANADSPLVPVTVMPATFAMIEEGEGGETLPTPPNEADIQRRERLEELLKEDAGSSGRGANDDRARQDRLRELLKQREPSGTERVETPEAKQDGDRTDKQCGDRGSGASDGSSSGQFAEPYVPERLPEVAGGTLMLPELRAVSTATKPIGNGRLPEDFVADDSLITVPLPEDVTSRGLVVAGAVLPWAAPNTYSHPLYFEDRMLERHGHERWGCMQPIASGARFFTTLPMLPYLATIQPPCDTVYSKGYFRAGSPAPRLVQRPPLERRAVIVEAAAISGAFIALP